MDCASNFVYFKKQQKKGEEEKEEDDDKWSWNSDELNRSFNSDEDEEEPQLALFDQMPIEQNRSQLFSNQNIAAPSMGFAPIPPPPFPGMQEVKAKKSTGGALGGLFGAIKSVFTGAKATAEMAMPNVSKMAKARYRRQGRKFRHEIDSNVIALNLKVLKEDAELAAGDPVFCKNCRAVFNMFSKLEEKEKRLEDIKEEVDEEMDEENKAEDALMQDIADERIEEDKEEGDRIWTCEFWSHKNYVSLEKEEIPTKDAINYIIDTEEVVGDKKNLGDSAIIFCIDISGSMCVTKAVEGKFKIKGDRYDELQALMKFSDGSDQFAFNDRNVTYVSRLQWVQAAIEAQLIDMKNEKSTRKVGLVSFNGDVNIIGDGSQVSQVISGDKLNNYEYLLENGQKIAKTHMQQSIDTTEKQLNEKLFSLEETGPTALGPAVVSAISIAGEWGNGSTVVIWTDGLANVGVGWLEENKEGGQANVALFYQNLADYAYSKGVTVNIISIKGEECDLETLSPLYDKTGGSVDIIEPDELQNNFANMLKKEIIATKVITKVKLHKALEFRNEDPANLNADKTMLTRNIGNITEDSEITFEYRVKSPEELEKLKDFDADKIDQIPFQTIIEYTKLDGMKWIRTITKVQQVTDDANKAKEDIKIDLLAVNAAQQASKLAMQGNFREAQAYSLNQKHFINSNIKSDQDQRVYSNWKNQMNEIYNDIHEQNNIEEVAMEAAEVDDSGLERKQKKGFFSKLGDKLSKNMQQKKQFNKNWLI